MATNKYWKTQHERGSRRRVKGKRGNNGGRTVKGEIRLVAWTIVHRGGGVEEARKSGGNARRLSGGKLENRWRWLLPEARLGEKGCLGFKARGCLWRARHTLPSKCKDRNRWHQAELASTDGCRHGHNVQMGDADDRRAPPVIYILK